MSLTLAELRAPPGLTMYVSTLIKHRADGFIKGAALYRTNAGVLHVILLTFRVLNILSEEHPSESGNIFDLVCSYVRRHRPLLHLAMT